MARIRREDEHNLKRKEILDVAQRLVYTKGYEQMSIQDILSELHMSKGAFYHYFESKQALLEGIIERTLNEAMGLLQPILADPNLKALEKLEHYFLSAATWKAQRKEAMLELLRVWYADENALVRQKMFSGSIKKIAPTISPAIQQGIDEGVFQTTSPDQAAEFIIVLMQSLGDAFADMIINRTNGIEKDHQERDLKFIQDKFKGYTEAIERVLGAAPGSLHLIDYDSLKEWLV